MLNDQQIERYSRQIILPQLGGRGQEQLLAASVAVVERNHVSAVAALYLAAAGVGRLAVAPAATVALAAVNPDCAITALPERATPTAAAVVVRTCAVVLVSGADETTYDLWNAACVAERTPLVWAEARGSHGLVCVLGGSDTPTPCHACLRAQLPPPRFYGEQTDTLTEATAAFIGSVQATEAIKLMLGIDASQTGRLLSYDARAGTLSEHRIAPARDCATCGAHA